MIDHFALPAPRLCLRTVMYPQALQGQSLTTSRTCLWSRKLHRNHRKTWHNVAVARSFAPAIRKGVWRAMQLGIFTEGDMLTRLKSTSARNDTTWLRTEMALYSFEGRKKKLFKLSWVFRWKCWVLLEISDVGDVTMRWYSNVAFISSVRKPHNMIMAPNLESPLLQCFTFCCHIFSP